MHLIINKTFTNRKNIVSHTSESGQQINVRKQTMKHLKSTYNQLTPDPDIRREDTQINSSKEMTAQLIQKRRQALKKPFQAFTNVANRMEQVRVKNGVIYINDAKAENVNATYFALQSIRKPVIWIAGGDDTQTDYWELMSLVRQKVEAIIMIGEDNDRLYQLFAPVINDIYEASSMVEAVRLAHQISESGTRVLFSPACKPDIRFLDYQERGRQFVKAVQKL